MSKQSLAEMVRVVPAVAPQTGASARSGDWISLKGYAGCLIVVHIAMGHAATTAITVDKATAVAGTGNSDGITVNRVWKHTGAIGAAIAYAAVAAAASFTSSSTGSGQDVYLLDVRADELGDYDCIQLELGASNSANLVAAQYILYGPRYAGSPVDGFTIDATVD